MTDFDNIWLPLADRFYRVAYYMLESSCEAEDAVQELFLKLWKSRDRLSGLRNPAAYGISLLKNICIDRIRRREVRRSEMLDAAAPLEGPPPETRMSAKEMLGLVMEEIGKLPPKQAEVMRLIILEDLDYGKIEKRTGLSQIHIRVLVSTARKTLKNKLKL